MPVLFGMSIQKILFTTGLVAFCLLSNATAEFTPNTKPTLAVTPMQGAITIDGDADDSGWRNAARAENFCETRPGDQIEPPVTSEVYLTYSESHLYILFKAYDDPSQVRATMVERDNIFRDDYFGIILDTYGDKAWAYELFVNPYGIQGDLRWTDDGEDMSFDIVWKSEGKITADGWQVEVAIPFRSLRFPNQPEQTWLATFWRDHPRESRRKYSWAAIDRDDPCWLCNFGTITGIKNVHPGGRLDILPSVIATQAGQVRDFDHPSDGFDNADPDAEMALNLKYSVSTDITAEGTINPDFSQVESDATQIDVNSTTALFYPERRPFFQEGSDLFSTWLSVVYTRSINDPQAAGKLYGRVGRTSVAFVGASDENAVAILPFEDRSRFVSLDKAFSSIFRLKQTIGESSYLGTSITDRRWEGGGSGSIIAADGRVRLHKNYSLEFQVSGSHTGEPDDGFLELDPGESSPTFDRGRRTIDFDGESFWGHAGYASIEFNSRSWFWDLDYWEYSPRFRADNGFVTRNDSRLGDLSLGRWWNFDKGFFEEVGVYSDIGRKWNFEKEFKDEWLRPTLYLDMKAQTSVEISMLFSREQFADTVIGGIRTLNLWTNSRFSQVVAVGAQANVGKQIARRIDYPVLAKTQSYGVWARVRPTDRLIWEPELSFFALHFESDLDTTGYPGAGIASVSPGAEISRSWVLRNRVNYQVTRRLMVRCVVEYVDVKNSYDPDDSDRLLLVEPLITYEVNPFTIFYIGSSHNYYDFEYSGFRDIRRSSQQFFAKLQYLFQT